jgi:hypothetical protein
VQATVLIPTHDHSGTLPYPVAAAQAQTLRDIEIFVVGDGAPPRTRELMDRLCRADPRLRYFHNPKGARHGEAHRAEALRHARGRVVCYLADDDLWLPTHLERMCEALQDADFAHSFELLAPPDADGLRLNGFDIGDPADLQRMMACNHGFGLSCGGHTLEAYRRLPHGWRPAPEDVHTDIHMWRQFASEPWVRMAAVSCFTTLKFASPQRAAWPLQQRLDELARWSEVIADPPRRHRLAAAAIRALHRRSAHPRSPGDWIRVETPDRTDLYQLRQQIDFARGGNAARFLSCGWAEAESWGRWTDGPEARLTLRLEEPPARGLLLEAFVNGFVAPGRPTLEVDVACNGRRLDTWTFDSTDMAARSVRIETAAPLLDLRFQAPGALPASEFTDSPDHRRLGMGIRWLRLRPLTDGS